MISVKMWLCEKGNEKGQRYQEKDIALGFLFFFFLLFLPVMFHQHLNNVFKLIRFSRAEESSRDLIHDLL